MTKLIIGGSLAVGLVLSFHDTLWHWAFIPAGIVWGAAILGLLLERREQSH